MSCSSILNRLVVLSGLYIAVFARSLRKRSDPDCQGIRGEGGRFEFAQANGADYRLGANDRVRIIVFGQPTLTGEYTLDGNGVLAFPLIGSVAASGQSPTQLQKA